MNSRTIALTPRLFATAFVGALMIGAALPTAARAQMKRFEVHSIGGFFVPTGDQRDELKDAMMLGLGGGYQLTPKLSVVGNFAWSGSKAKQLIDEPNVNIYHYDVGAQYRVAHLTTGGDWHFLPFLGAGIGGRTYDTEQNGVETQTNFTGYGSLGMEVQYKKLGWRIEGRDYLSSYTGLTGASDRTTRSDVGILTGMTLRF